MSHILRGEAESEGDEIGEPITADVYRFDPTRDPEPHLQRYTVPYRHRMTIFTLLREIYEHQDPTLAFRNQQCGRGICGTCRYRIEKQGRVVKGCTIPLDPGDRILVRPYNEAKVIRDLVVDL
jgi:succinate dehydrogenase/fumarate reductase-like Fe-S protein